MLSQITHLSMLTVGVATVPTQDLDFIAAQIRLLAILVLSPILMVIRTQVTLMI